MSSKSSTSVSRRSFLRSGATAAALAAAGAAFGCAPSGSESLSATGEKADVADLNEHVVESDTAILERPGPLAGRSLPQGLLSHVFSVPVCGRQRPRAGEGR